MMDAVTPGESPSPAPRRLRSAMFVDFDNVYSLLHRLDPEAAKTFAEDPSRWVGDLSRGSDADGPFVRRFLVQKCYLNPDPYSRYRPNFTRAGFQVVDCPSLTQRGKSSADINLVLDAMDALAASTRFDEFVFLSADADFTPLVIRCRAADRLVTIVTPGPAAAAYRSVADSVVSADLFLRLLSATTPQPVLEAPVLVTPEGAAEPLERSIPSPVLATDPVAVVSQLVLSADRPVALSTAATAAMQSDPSLRESAWGGAGSFTAWMQQFAPHLALDTRTPGYVWDPARFSDADLKGAPAVVATNGQRDSGLTELQRRVVAITEVPGLGESEYRLVLEQLAFDLALFPFSRTDTSKRVRDECAKSDTPIGRGAISFVINGLIFAGADLEAEPSSEQLAAVWTENVLGLCRGARLELDESDLGEISTWVSGGLVATRADG